MHSLVEKLKARRASQGLTLKELANGLGVPDSTVEGWFTAATWGNNPSPANLNKIASYLENATGAPPRLLLIEKSDVRPIEIAPARQEEARRRAQKVKYLLLLLEDELRWFRENSEREREVFRNALDPFDVGYISSLLNMMREEDKFQRWLALTTNKFSYLRKRSNKGGQKSPN